MLVHFAGLPPRWRFLGLYSRKASWPYYLIGVAISLLILQNVSPTSDLTSFLIPLGFQRVSEENILHPGDFIDPTRQRTYPEPKEGPSFLDVERTGRSHDARNERFFLGGTRSLTTQTEPNASHPTPLIYDPYPDYNNAPWRQLWRGEFKPCRGPRNTYLERTLREDMVAAYPGTQQDFPFPMFGSYDSIGLDGNVCFDRYARLGAYGYDANDTDVPGFPQLFNMTWDTVDWGGLQAQCLQRNANRYKPHQTVRRAVHNPLTPSVPDTKTDSPFEPLGWSSQQYKQRTAVIMRTWHNMNWTPNHRQYLRSMVMELSLHSGAEFEVFLLVDVKDEYLPLFSDADSVQYFKEFYVPREFHNMTVLFNNKMLEAWYPKLEEHRPIYQHLQPVQIFSQLYPNFDYYWQFEMDARNTGHMYHFLDRAVEFAKQQPRRYLWERNAYFYTPGAHGEWKEFTDMVNRSMAGCESVWGPKPVDNVVPIGPTPPVATPEEDDYEWGVGEEADLITFLPIFDPSQTTWTFPNTLYNLPPETPRRASPVTMWRLSKRLLDLIHHAQAVEGIGLASEMTGPSWALWHGFKAVHVPHPMYVDGHWTAQELAQIYNPGRPEKINGGPHSIWNWNHMADRIMYRISYMFTTQTAEDLFRRWLGYQPDPNQYTDGRPHQDHWGLSWYEGGQLNEETYGRLCFPPMFLHTIKNTEPEKGPDQAVPV